MVEEILARMKEIENNENTHLPIVDGWDAWAELKSWLTEQAAKPADTSHEKDKTP